jgi:hypothetical protein
MINYNDLIELKDGPVQYVPTGGGHLRLANHPYPWSIVNREFDFIYNTIVDNKLTRGYEACTGVGISGLAAALAMKETGGKIVSLDAYVEERLNFYNYDNQKILLENADGYKSVFYLREKFKVEDQFLPEVGWTPDDVPAVIEKHFTEPLDYVFIDGGHVPSQLILDIEAVLPYTNDNTFWLFHDANHNLWTQPVIDYCREKLNSELKIMCPHQEGCCDLGMLFKVK